MTRFGAIMKNCNGTLARWHESRRFEWKYAVFGVFLADKNS